MNPLVSIIAISYNHSAFIQEALASIYAQNYQEYELIIIDDNSEDNSVDEIKKCIEGKDVQFIPHTKNQGYTKTFNEGLKLAKGKYVVDFAMDDIMLPHFIEASVKCLANCTEDYGLVFSNADYVDKNGAFLANHNQLLFDKNMLPTIPSGDVFQWVLKRYFICTPTMVMKAEMLRKLGGYDESLAYEDFDLWVRASRYWKFAFLDEVTIKKRKLNHSMSAQRHLHHYNELMSSVLKVCYKAFHLCKSKEDFLAFYERLNYEYRQCVKFGAEDLVNQYLVLLKESGGKRSVKSRTYRFLKRKFRVV